MQPCASHSLLWKALANSNHKRNAARQTPVEYSQSFRLWHSVTASSHCSLSLGPHHQSYSCVDLHLPHNGICWSNIYGCLFTCHVMESLHSPTGHCPLHLFVGGSSPASQWWVSYYLSSQGNRLCFRLPFPSFQVSTLSDQNLNIPMSDSTLLCIVWHCLGRTQCSPGLCFMLGLLLLFSSPRFSCVTWPCKSVDWLHFVTMPLATLNWLVS